MSRVEKATAFIPVAFLVGGGGGGSGVLLLLSLMLMVMVGRFRACGGDGLYGAAAACVLFTFAPQVTLEGGASSRVSRLWARCVTWELPSIDTLSTSIATFADVDEFCSSDDSNGSLQIRAWPRLLMKMEFGRSSRLNQRIEGVTLPDSLHQLTFGGIFDQPIGGVTWPTSLQQLTFIRRQVQPADRRCRVADIFAGAHVSIWL